MRILASIALLCAPGAAFACAVCGDNGAPNAGAYLDSTIFLSLLPLAMLGGGAFWVYRRTLNPE